MGLEVDVIGNGLDVPFLVTFFIKVVVNHNQIGRQLVDAVLVDDQLLALVFTACFTDFVSLVLVEDVLHVLLEGHVSAQGQERLCNESVGGVHLCKTFLLVVEY